MKSILTWIIAFGLGISIVFIMSLIMAFPIMWLWNYAVVIAITIAKPITYWVAFCLLLISGILIKSGSTSKS